jgi:hypothetical protein
MKFDPDVWGPHYWFFLHSIAYSYPESPNAVTKRKYYDLIQNFPLFIPVSEMGDKFSRLLDKYPVSPYLSSRESIIRWVHFIHNKVNGSIGHPEITYMESVDEYYAKYKSVPAILIEKVNTRRYYIFMALILLFLFLIFYFYD